MLADEIVGYMVSCNSNRCCIVILLVLLENAKRNIPVRYSKREHNQGSVQPLKVNVEL